VKVNVMGDLDWLHLTRTHRLVLGWLVLLLATVGHQGVCRAVGWDLGTGTAAPMRFTGRASGGTLCFHSISEAGNHVVRVETAPGEHARSVAARLASAIDSSPIGLITLAAFVEEPADMSYVQVDETTLRVTGISGRYATGGTETGLGIPVRPSSVCGQWDTDGSALSVHWLNNGAYDKIRVAAYSPKHGCTSRPVDAAASRYVFSDLGGPQETGLVQVIVTGYRQGVPSNAARAWIGRCAVLDVPAVPFSQEVAVNWHRWGQADVVAAAEYGSVISRQPFEGDAPEANGDVSLRRRGQLVRWMSPETPGGLMRYFPGLLRGRTYRVSVRVSTLDIAADPSASWSLKVYTGQTRLPEGSLAVHEGPSQVAQLLRDNERTVLMGTLDQSRVTGDDWVTVSTSAAQPDGGPHDIVLSDPEDVLFVCLRFQGTMPSGAAFDLVRVEDVTSSP